MSTHQISTPPTTSLPPSPSPRPVQSPMSVSPASDGGDIFALAPRAAGSHKLPRVDKALVREVLAEVAPRVESLTGLKVAAMPRIDLVAREELYQRVVEELRHDSHLGEHTWQQMRPELVAVFGPKRLWRALPAIYQPRTNTLAVATDGMPDKNYDSLRLWLLGNLITCAVYQAYPEYLAGIDEAWMSYVDKVTQFGVKSDAAQSAKSTFFTRQCLASSFAGYWRRKAKPRYFPQASAPSAGLLGNIAALCSKNMRSMLWQTVKTDSILKQCYENPREFGGEFIANLFKTPADQDYFLTQRDLKLANSIRELGASVASLQATLDKFEELRKAAKPG